MRDSEFHQSARGKPDSTQLKMTNYSPDLSSFIGEDDFVELLWENGPVVAQGQSNRNKKSSMVDRVSRDLVDRSSEKDTRDVEFPKAGRLEIMNSFMHNFSLPGPSNNVQLNAQYDELAPWMNYQVDDAIPTDYCSEFLSDVPGNNLSSLSVHSNSTPVPRTSGFCHTFKGFGVENGSTSKLLEDSSDPNRARFSQCYELLHQNQTSAPSTKSRDEVFCIAGGNGSQQGPSGNWDCTRLEKHDPTTAKTLNQSSIGVMNFSHFSRPVALAKANLHSVERLKSIENPSTATSSKTMESTVIQSTTGCQTRTEEPSSPVTTKLDNKSSGKTLREMLPVEQSKVDCQKDTSNSNVRINYASSNCMSTDHTNHQSINFTKCLSLRSPEAERGHEPVVASSSVCSANSAGGASDEPKHQVKRKDQEIEESDNLSADLEDESVGQRKSASTKGTSAKRSRAAEVHNLSERRRRDRINEKMRALQELIPNCNKVDKASMLDEAIEYLKTLQLQVQMMSMGGGICMPPMMPPVGMQHIRMPPVAHFSQMGLGMGMGMRFGYAMGMIDMNGSPNCTLVPVPPMHSPQFHCTPPSVPGPQGLSLMPGPTTLPVFGIPRQGQPMSITGAPSISCAPGLPATSNSVPEVPPMDATNQEHPAVSGPSSSCAEQKEGNMDKCRANDSQGIQESFKDSSIMRTNSKEMHTSENRDVN